MNFKYKCLLQKTFSALPRGENINFLFQRHVTKSFPEKNEKFLRKVNQAVEHQRLFEKYNELKSNQYRYYEFGAGWSLTIPLAMCFMGFEVHCIDIRKLIRHDIILDTLNKFENNANQFSFDVAPIGHQAIKPGNILDFMSDSYPFNYYAPMDARETNYKDNSFDFISSSVTMEHIPHDDILAILKESYRLLEKGGVLSMTIDYQDHWSYFDKSISIYNFLRYPSKKWKKYNPSLHYQNRLRHSDYMALIAQTDFKVAMESPRLPSDENIKQLQNLTLADEFKNYKFDDVAIRGSELVLVK